MRLVPDHYNKNLNSHEFRETSETDYSSNKNDPQSSLGNSNHTKLNQLNSKLSLLQSFVSGQLICFKKTQEEITDLYQRNENTSTYTTALIKKTDDLKEENKMKNRIIQSLIEHNNAVLWQTKDQIVAIENTHLKMLLFQISKKQLAHISF